MREYRVLFTPEGARGISLLHPEHQKTIRTALDLLRRQPYSGDDLHGDFAAFKSFKPKRFRIIYTVEDDERVVRGYEVGHRRDVYDQFRRLLSSTLPKKQDGK